MNEFITFLPLVFAGCALLLTGFVFFKKQKLQEDNRNLLEKLSQLESKLQEQQVIKQPSYEKKTQKKSSDSHSEVQTPSHAQSQQVLELKKESVKIKEELIKTREKLMQGEKSFKTELSKLENKVLDLQEQNTELVQQLKEASQSKSISSAETTKTHSSSENEIAVKTLKQEVYVAKQRITELEKMLAAENNKTANAIEKMRAFESDLKKWQDVAKLAEGKKLTPEIFRLWYDRAHIGKKMYLMMKQMRELSDEKLQTYQEGVTSLSQWVLEQFKIPAPQISSGEIAADRLLAAAWSAIEEKNKAETTSPSDETTEASTNSLSTNDHETKSAELMKLEQRV